MRRYGNFFKDIASEENIYAAYRRARKGKSWQRVITDFERDIEGNVAGIRKTLLTGTYTTSPYRVKIINEPKRREIYILPFDPDRIVQHAIMNIVEPIWENLFIDDSYACRRGKGIHAGSLRTSEFVRRNAYCLQCDISKFYPSIDHDVLYGIVERKIKCAPTLGLMRDIIYSIPGGTNIPIGNYTSQWFGNLYLNELDQKAKHVWKVRDYIRYCDDFLFFGNDKSQLKELKVKVHSFLADMLHLRLSKCELFPVSHGVDFLGYRHFKDYILVRKSTAKRMRRKMKGLEGRFFAGLITRDQVRSTVASIRGWLGWANSHNLAQSFMFEEVERLYGSTQEIY